MSWKAIDRQSPVVDADAPPILSEAVRAKIAEMFPRYATKRAVLLPALHIVQDALGHVPPQAQIEIAELLDLHPSQVADTMSFYTHYWDHPKGTTVVVVCRSISCDILGGEALLQAVKDHLGIDEHESTADGRYALMTEECLALCDGAPAMLVGERAYASVKPEDVPTILDNPDAAKINVPRSTIYDGPGEG